MARDREVAKIIQKWERARIVPDPANEATEARQNASHDLTPFTVVLYAAVLDPDAFRKGCF